MNGKRAFLFRKAGRPALLHGALLALMLTLLLLALPVVAAVAPIATAHFSYAQLSLGGGFSSPFGVAVDKSGNVFVADTDNSAVKEIPLGCVNSGCVKTLGSGFSGPYGIAVDGSGNVFVADTVNSTVKEILAAGGYVTVQTLGSGFYFPEGVAVDGSGNVFVADSSNNAVKEILAVGGYTTVNTLGGGFDIPTGVAVDGNGNVFVADSGASAVKEIPSGCVTSSCVSTLGGGFNAPDDVAVDGSGNVFVADSWNYEVKEILAASGYKTVNTLASGPNALFGVAVDGSGNVYVGSFGISGVVELESAAVDFGTNAVGQASAAIPLTFTFDNGGTIVSPVALTQGAANLDFAVANGGTCTAGTYSTGATCTVNVTFTPTFAGVRQGAVQLQSATGVTIATAYVHGIGSGPLAAFGPGIITTLVTDSTSYVGITSIAADATGNVFIAAEDAIRGVEVVLKRTPGGVITTVAGGGNGCPQETDIFGDGCPATSVSLNWTNGLALDGAGNLYISDTGYDVIHKVTPEGMLTTVAGSYSAGFSGDGGPATSAQLLRPFGLALDGAGNLYIADSGNNVIRKVTPGGIITTYAGTYASGYAYGGDGGPATSAQFYNPIGIGVDGSGDVYIAAASIRKVTPGGIITTVAGNLSGGYSGDGGPATSAELSNPSGSIAVDAAGNFYFSDTTNNVVRKVTPGGIITTIAGTYQLTSYGTPQGGTSGDGGPATSAQLFVPAGVALDGAGNVYIVDSIYGAGFVVGTAIRKVDVSAPSLTFASTSVGAASASQDVTVLNLGNAPLNISQISTAANFSLGGSDTSCSASSQTLAAAASCVLSIEFNPTAVGSISGSVVLTDNALNASAATQTIALQGTGTTAVSQTSPAAMQTPAAGSVLGSSNVSFTWSSGVGVTEYQFILGSTGFGSSNLYASGVTAATTVTVASVPANAVTVYARLFSKINGVWSSVDYTYVEAGTLTPAAMQIPTAGSVLGSSNVSFTWSSGVGVAEYQFILGSTGVGSSNLYASGVTAATTVTVASIPANAVTVYARLFSKINGVWSSVDYTYLEAGTLTPATMQNPTAGSVLGSSNVSFTWSSGVGVAEYQFILGSTGVGSSNLYASGVTAATTVTVASIPANAVTVYARLFSKINGVWSSVDYTYLEAGTLTPATMQTPTAGSVLGSSNVSFTWSSGVGVAEYQFILGSTGVGSSNLYASGVTAATTVTVASIPANAVTVYARLFSKINGVWSSVDYTYTEAGTLTAAVLQTPTAGSTLGSSNVSFTWNSGVGVTEYQFVLGSTGVGSSNLYASGITAATTVTVPSILTNAVTVYARLFSKINGVWLSHDYTYVNGH